MANGNKVLVLGGSSYIGRHLFEKLGTKLAVGTYYSNPVQAGVYFAALSTRLSEIVQSPEEFTHAIVLLGDTRAEFCAAHPNESHALNVASI